MTRLFLRFYLGVVMILITAWLIQGYVVRERNESQNIRVVERALSGGARLARQRILDAPQDQKEKVYHATVAEFDYPVRVVDIAERPMDDVMCQRLKAGDIVLHDYGMIEAQFPNSTKLLEFGPLPQFVGPSQTEVTLGYGAVFALAAAAIAILLRPVATQLRAVERTATAISKGDLSARIDAAHWPRSLPLANAFNTMADRTETLLRTQRELLQAVSHELRTPLARIRFAADLIGISKTDEERSKRLESVDKATQELDDLVGELLTYVRLESDDPQRKEETFTVGELLDEVVDIHAPLRPEVKIDVECESNDIYIHGDRPSLSRAIANLVRNASRFARDRIIVSVKQEEDIIRIEVNDDGDGIKEADRARVFMPFVRLDNSSGGTGLGLALVQRIATRHRGSVRALDSPLGGARFQLDLPVDAVTTPVIEN